MRRDKAIAIIAVVLSVVLVMSWVWFVIATLLG
jgi:hypothetical protein